MDSASGEKMMLMKQLDEAFRELRKQILTEWNKHNTHGLGMTHGKLLLILSESGPQKATTLAEGLSITSGGVTGIADRLIELGYVSRERSEQDRRVVLLKLTEEGQATINAIHELREKVMLKLYRGMSDEDMAQALALFRRMGKNMEEQ